MRHITPQPTWRAVSTALLTLCMIIVHAAAGATISQDPLFLQKQLEPNLMYTIDNSGSMPLYSIDPATTNPNADMADTTNLSANPPYTARNFYNSVTNRIYYDPAVTYEAARDYDGTSLGNKGGSGATYYARLKMFNPLKGVGSANTTQRDHSSNLIEISRVCYVSDATTELTRPSYNKGTGVSAITCNPYLATRPKPLAMYAFYYTSDSAPGRVDIVPTRTTYPKAASRTDCGTGSTCSYEQEILNFANWFTYYRTRLSTAQTATSLAFTDVGAKYRVGFGKINRASGDAQATDTVNNETVRLGVRIFNSAAKQNWYQNYLFNITNTPNMTPLRRAVDDVGQYFSRADSKGPWGATPGSGTEATTEHYACRKNYHILMTDGYWNDAAAYTTGTSNADSNPGSAMEGKIGSSNLYYKFDPDQNQPVTCTKPAATVVCTPCTTPGTNGCEKNTYYKSTTNNTLADVAMHYWKTDLRSDLSNVVPKTDTNPAFWQHVSQYTISLGVDGSIPSTPAKEAELKAGTQLWPATITDSSKQGIDDLWHAAVNGRGKFINAKDSSEFKNGLKDLLQEIASTPATASTETASSAVLKSDTYVFEPSFVSVAWTGTVRAYNSETWALQWDAALKLPAHGSRVIATKRDDTGAIVAFQPANLSPAQLTHLGSTTAEQTNIVAYLRGDGSKEKSQTNGIYRNRTTKLGDIVNSSPLYVKKGVDQGYSTLPGAEGTAYTTFLNGTGTGQKSGRKAMIYVGANDGMFHAFDARVGETDSGKELLAYVPAAVYPNLKSLSATDYATNHKYFVDGQMTEGDAYIGGGWKTYLLGTGGAGAKSVFAVDITDPTSLGISSVKWEIAGNDIGNVLGEARVARLKNGSWVAIFGNGYGSANGTAKLLIRNLSDGTEYKTVATDSTSANGLSTPALVYDEQNNVIAAYAGDLQGNLWRFNLADPTTPTSTKLFTANTGQAIIQRPVYKEHPRGGTMVLFGTGKYFEVGDGDLTDTTTQSLYGIWDKPFATVPTRSNLQQQVLTAVLRGGIGADRNDVVAATIAKSATTVTSPQGWYIDLTLNSGERAIANPVLLDDVFITKTLIPYASYCDIGGNSLLYGVNYITGGANTTTAFTSYDVIRLGGGGTAGLQVMQKDGKVYIRTKEFTGTGNPPGSTEFKSVSPGFRTWRQIPISY